MIAYIIIINLYTYICWAQRSRSGRCRSRNQTLPWVWFGCWFVSGLPLKTGFVFIFFLCYCLRSLILAPATLSDLHLILILRLLASPVGRFALFCVLSLTTRRMRLAGCWLGSHGIAVYSHRQPAETIVGLELKRNNNKQMQERHGEEERRGK